MDWDELPAENDEGRHSCVKEGNKKEGKRRVPSEDALSTSGASARSTATGLCECGDRLWSVCGHFGPAFIRLVAPRLDSEGGLIDSRLDLRAERLNLVLSANLPTFASPSLNSSPRTQMKFRLAEGSSPKTHKNPMPPDATATSPTRQALPEAAAEPSTCWVSVTPASPR